MIAAFRYLAQFFISYGIMGDVEIVVRCRTRNVADSVVNGLYDDMAFSGAGDLEVKDRAEDLLRDRSGTIHGINFAVEILHP